MQFIKIGWQRINRFTQSQCTHFTFTLERHESRDRLSRAGDDHAFTELGFIYESGKLGLGFVDVDYLHGQ